MLIQYKENFAIVNLILKDICNDENYLFGRIPIILGGDFIQTFLVVSQGIWGV